ncbi:MAG: SDR family oxidoreductase [Arthrobacter sp.]|uniref:SDR family oxidoreductase n=1 Tax=unclassified Arthrobacter TaxID=235627 RepID=UPI002652A789|nr:SDR family oxidoreductase [Micrococcaceae bacterium]MDN5825306.1 SDR family oxidoreductase [Micrococcaceae bacterium]MDN5880608.1 SDR family oxidoreductase [Micrococcaceae bacterium]MDN5906641.1 SDR family oxidoreductase [Micrococcaceae bacterium]MDN6171145.1 SDR family oxidoreductase [Micrococcaceae bacterium]
MNQPHTAVVTGAARGIGRAVVEALAHDPDGPPQLIAALDADFTQECRHTRVGDTRVVEYRADVADADRVAEIFDQLAATHPPVLKIAHAAGVLHEAALADTDLDGFARVMDVNVRGTFVVLRQAARTLGGRRPLSAPGEAGSIAVVSSNAAAVPRVGMAAYAASKAAAAALSANAALELAPLGIRCNTIAPGSTDTPMQQRMWSGDPEKARARVVGGTPDRFRLGIPLGRIAEPQDIAEVVLFSLSRRARHMTMQDIVVDGGASLRSC